MTLRFSPLMFGRALETKESLDYRGAFIGELSVVEKEKSYILMVEIGEIWISSIPLSNILDTHLGSLTKGGH